MLAISHSPVFRLRAAGQLPDSVRVGPRAVRWRISDIRAYIANL